MPPLNDEAIVLRTTDFSETSMVVTFFTRENGKVTCLAKGARRLKNPFDTSLDAMNICRILYYPKIGDVLQLVTEAKLTERFRVDSTTAIYAGFHVVQLLNHFTENFNPQSALFDLTKNVLKDILLLDSICRTSSLDNPPEKLSRCLFHYELRLMSLSGLAPSFHECVGCSEKVEIRRGARRIAFGMRDGGVLCPRCRPGRMNVVSLSPEALGAFQLLASADERYWRRLQLSQKTLGEIRGLWNQYLAYQMERPVPILHWLKR
ncbi:MAG: DNA repair protein RecO [Planctomycetaceae bacterium]|nr:DNA repair protein RecO [Planctomycetaceae bacterium]